MQRASFSVQIPEGETIRLDKFIATLNLFPRSQIARRSVRAWNSHGTELKFARRLRVGDAIDIQWEDLPPTSILPESMDINVIYEDENCAVIDKPTNLVVHPAAGHPHGTLIQGLLHRYAGLENQFSDNTIRPGIVHRLDKDTSGLIIIAKNQFAMDFLSEKFRQRQVKKTYLAINRGILPAIEGEINTPIGRDPRDRKKFKTDTRNAKEAITRYRILARNNDYNLIKVNILTGRTHQIRVHLKSLNAPILGDPIYGRKDGNLPEISLLLHAWKLSLILPSNVKCRFEADIPPRFLQAAESLGLNWFATDRNIG